MSATTTKTLRPQAEAQEIIILITLVAVWALMSLTTSTFLTLENFKSVLYSVAPIIIIGVGMTCVIVTAGIDVSVGAQVAVVMVTVGQVLKSGSSNPVIVVGIALVLGAVLGGFNAFFVATLGIHPMIVTFGSLNIFRFIALQIFGDEQVSGIPPTFGFIGGNVSASTLAIPNAMWLGLFLGALMWLYMRYAASGRHLYAIGGDKEAARLAGIHVKTRLYSVYVLTGMLAGLAGLVMLGSGGLVQQNVGIGLELKVIAAVVIGGTSILGGKGSVLGTILGATLVATLASAVTHLNWPSELTNLFVGLIIVAAVGADLITARRREGKK